ncbi:aerolysin-like protein [Silurus meridionalis]|nr:aerolysin-like protein [Silurus meridionalis]
MSKSMSYLADIHVIGGKGGNPFNFNGTENGSTLRKIWVWVGEWQIKAIKVWLTDGQSRDVGQPGGKVLEFTFEDGEHFTSLSLWGNGAGTRLGGIKFKTNRSHEFFAHMKTEYPIDVGSGICMGITGRADEDVDSLGFLFINTVKSTVLTDVQYPTLHSVIPYVAVEEIKSMTYYNNSTQTQEYRIETSKKITKKSSWSVSNSLEFSFSMETVEVDITIGRATVDLPYNGTVKITCYNNSVLQFKTSGTYKDLSYTNGKVVVNKTSKKIGQEPETVK